MQICKIYIAFFVIEVKIFQALNICPPLFGSNESAYDKNHKFVKKNLIQD